MKKSVPEPLANSNHKGEEPNGPAEEREREKMSVVILKEMMLREKNVLRQDHTFLLKNNTRLEC